MRFLVDAQLPPALTRWLRGRGHEAIHVADIGFVSASDDVIADRAAAQGEVLVSKDEDFVMLRLPDRFALLWLRCGNASNRALAVWLEPRWSTIEAQLANRERLVEVR